MKKLLVLLFAISLSYNIYSQEWDMGIFHFEFEDVENIEDARHFSFSYTGGRTDGEGIAFSQKDNNFRFMYMFMSSMPTLIIRKGGEKMMVRQARSHRKLVRIKFSPGYFVEEEGKLKRNEDKEETANNYQAIQNNERSLNLEFQSESFRSLRNY